MSTAGTHEPNAAIERFLKALIVAYKAVVLYPPSSTIPRDTSAAAAAALRELLMERHELVIGVTKNSLVIDNEPYQPARAAYSSLALDLYARRLADVRFRVGTTGSDILGLLAVLAADADEVEASGGFESRLWEQGVTAISGTEVRVSIVDSVTAQPSEPDLTRALIDEALGLGADRSRDNRVLERLLASPTDVASYLTSVATEPGGSTALATARFELLAALRSSRGDIEIDVPKSLSEALTCIDAALRSDLLLDDLVAEARVNEDVAEVIRRVEAVDMFRMLTAGVDPDAPPVAELARAVRQIRDLTPGNPGEIESAAGIAMSECGMSAEHVDEVLRESTPEKLTVTADFSGSSDQLTHANSHDIVAVDEEQIDAFAGIEELRAEAQLGLTSTDTARVLAELVTAGLSDGRFETTMVALESALRLAVLRRETRALSDITQTLVVAAKDPSLTVQQRMRVDAVVGRLAEPGEIRSIVDTMRLAPPNSKERQGARDVLDALGERAIAPLIEQLAAEPEMSARKALIELLSTMAPRYIAEVGGYVSDGRWYVVRNVVTILGSAKSSAVIPYLERALRHPEERVRRESIRALSGLSDGAAQRGLMSALSDEDAQNVRLAARYLGAGKVVAAVPALEQVARGEGIGSRELGPRVEAIDALGRIGAVTALPTLDALAARRLLQGGRPKELRIAAATAVAKIKGFGGPV